MSVIPYICQNFTFLIGLKAKNIRLSEINRFFIVINSIILLISCQNTSTLDDFKVFRYNSSNGISSLDPAFARTQENIRAVNQLFNGLVQLDDSLNIKPAIAKSWKISSDGKLYTFTLRKDVLFHKHPLFKNTAERTADAYDFEYSFRRLIDPKTASDGAWIFNGITKGPGAFNAVNDSTFTIQLERPFAPLLNMLSMAYCYVVPEIIVEEIGTAFGKSPVGTGPFQFANWAEGVKLNFKKNPEYFESTASSPIPKIDGISITFVQSNQTALLQMVQGQLDVFSGLESSFKDEILSGNGELKGKYSKSFDLLKRPFLNTEYLAFHMQEEPFKDSIVRRAINLAVNRSDMVRYLRNGIGKAAKGGFIPYGLPGYRPNNTLEHNPELAKALVNQLPPEKRTLKLTTTKDYLDLCILVQRDLVAVGFNVSVDPIPSSLLKQQKSAGDVTFFRSSWIADYPDGENYMACFYSKNHAPNGPNYTRYSNPLFDAYYEELIRSTDPKTKASLLQKMEQILAQDLPYVILFYDESIWIKPKYLTGLSINPLNHMDLRQLEINTP